MEIEPFDVEDRVPDEGEIEWAVKHLRNNRNGGRLRMRIGVVRSLAVS